MFGFKRPHGKEEKGFNFGAINAKILKCFNIQIKMYYFALNLGVKVSIRKSLLLFMPVFWRQNRNFEMRKPEED